MSTLMCTLRPGGTSTRTVLLLPPLSTPPASCLSPRFTEYPVWPDPSCADSCTVAKLSGQRTSDTSMSTVGVHGALLMWVASAIPGIHSAAAIGRTSAATFPIM
ncbi:hypothetical protein J5X84_00485 [Streptosporangiaceae bacterium NEAU-GS5]|nr:hypothetical protein [Streptosporangiaceae bacterium NEAU-GS5]